MPMTPAQLRALVESFEWDAYAKTLGEILSPFYTETLLRAGVRAARAAGGEWRPDDPYVQTFLTQYVGERIVQIEGTTKQAVIDVVQRTLASQEPGTVFDLGSSIRDAVREEFAGYERWRADRIARTESAIAENHGDILGYEQAGVDEVDVLDGTNDDECAAADGAVWTTEEALADPTAHPNCQRAFSPRMPDEKSARRGRSPADTAALAARCAKQVEIISQRIVTHNHGRRRAT